MRHKHPTLNCREQGLTKDVAALLLGGRSAWRLSGRLSWLSTLCISIIMMSTTIIITTMITITTVTMTMTMITITTMTMITTKKTGSLLGVF
jgi:hypothetical protein